MPQTTTLNRVNLSEEQKKNGYVKKDDFNWHECILDILMQMFYSYKTESKLRIEIIKLAFEELSIEIIKNLQLHKGVFSLIYNNNYTTISINNISAFDNKHLLKLIDLLRSNINLNLNDLIYPYSIMQDLKLLDALKKEGADLKKIFNTLLDFFINKINAFSDVDFKEVGYGTDILKNPKLLDVLIKNGLNEDDIDKLKKFIYKIMPHLIDYRKNSKRQLIKLIDFLKAKNIELDLNEMQFYNTIFDNTKFINALIKRGFSIYIDKILLFLIYSYGSKNNKKI